jgi:hypothetical protein
VAAGCHSALTTDVLAEFNGQNPALKMRGILFIISGCGSVIWPEAHMTAKKSLEERMLATAQKAKRGQDAIAALKEYHDERTRIDANMLRLRALRLAKEAADAKVLADQPNTRKKALRAK